MDEKDLERERRRQAALDRLGTNNPSCIICGENNWRVLERHHIAGRARDKTTVIVCRNCHRKLSDAQKDHQREVDETASLQMQVGQFLLGLCDLFLLLVEKLRAFGEQLIGSADGQDEERSS
jgi:hypothetical protein